MSLPLWLLAALGSVSKAAVALFGAVARHPWQTACIALLCASLWLYHGKSVALSDLKDCKAGRAADRKAYTEAQDAALKKALAAKAATEAGRIDTDAKQAHDSAMADADAYIRSHRVRNQAAGGSAGGTATATEDHRTGNGQGPGSAPELDEVAVNPEDIRICTTNTLQAEAARSWHRRQESNLLMLFGFGDRPRPRARRCGRSPSNTGFEPGLLPFWRLAIRCLPFCHDLMVPKDGIEPPTRGPSTRRSTV
jgi:hypothetical protein